MKNIFSKVSGRKWMKIHDKYDEILLMQDVDENKNHKNTNR
jgi:hypothetical protein